MQHIDLPVQTAGRELRTGCQLKIKVVRKSNRLDKHLALRLLPHGGETLQRGPAVSGKQDMRFDDFGARRFI